jgi:hypothetical protein
MGAALFLWCCIPPATAAQQGTPTSCAAAAQAVCVRGLHPAAAASKQSTWLVRPAVLRTLLLCMHLQVIVQDVPLESYVSMARFLDHFQPQACILMVRH